MCLNSLRNAKKAIVWIVLPRPCKGLIIRRSQRAYHFVCKNSIDASLVQPNQPVQAVKLVVSELASLEDRWLSLKSCQIEVCILISFISAFPLNFFLLGSSPGGVFIWSDFIAANHPHRLDSSLLHLLKIIIIDLASSILVLNLTLHDKLGESVYLV